ncbi:MAG: alpha-amylase family glycosyl hydrolase [Chitinophagia bacterium]|jgi:glycosidase
MDANFKTVQWADTISIYEVNIRQYTPEGTFKAFQKHLPRLQEMGVEVLWLMPITSISEKIRKGALGSYYACSSYTKINTEFGKEQDLIDLISKAHQLGMKVIIDWVANHTGRQHEWMQDHPDWFSRDEQGHFTERNGWEDVVDLNYHNNEMRAALIGAMQYWVRDFKIDGFRCDMAHLVPLDFWVAARKACEIIKPLFWLAECEAPQYHPTFDASYAWAWMHETEKLAKGNATINDIYNVLHSYPTYPVGAKKLFFTSNHDENSWNGTEYEKFGPAAKPWAVFTFTWSGIPLIYSGQELPNQKRLAFFDKDVIEWTASPKLHEFYKILIGLRKSHTCLSKGNIYNLPSQAEKTMAYLRYDEHGSTKEVILVVLNLGDQVQKINFDHALLVGEFKNAFSGLSFTFNKEVAFELMPGDYFVYVKA